MIIVFVVCLSIMLTKLKIWTFCMSIVRFSSLYCLHFLLSCMRTWLHGPLWKYCAWFHCDSTIHCSGVKPVGTCGRVCPSYAASCHFTLSWPNGNTCLRVKCVFRLCNTARWRVCLNCDTQPSFVNSLEIMLPKHCRRFKRS